MFIVPSLERLLNFGFGRNSNNPTACNAQSQIQAEYECILDAAHEHMNCFDFGSTSQTRG